MTEFSDRDKDHLFALLERQTRLLIMIVDNQCTWKYLTEEHYSELKEIKEFLNQ